MLWGESDFVKMQSDALWDADATSQKNPTQADSGGWCVVVVYTVEWLVSTSNSTIYCLAVDVHVHEEQLVQMCPDIPS